MEPEAHWGRQRLRHLPRRGHMFLLQGTLVFETKFKILVQASCFNFTDDLFKLIFVIGATTRGTFSTTA